MLTIVIALVHCSHAHAQTLCTTGLSKTRTDSHLNPTWPFLISWLCWICFGIAHRMKKHERRLNQLFVKMIDSLYVFILRLLTNRPETNMKAERRVRQWSEWQAKSNNKKKAVAGKASTNILKCECSCHVNEVHIAHAPQMMIEGAFQMQVERWVNHLAHVDFAKPNYSMNWIVWRSNVRASTATNDDDDDFSIMFCFFLSSPLFKDDDESSLLLSVSMPNANDTLHLGRANTTKECYKKFRFVFLFESSSFWCWLITYNDYENDPKCRFLSYLCLCIYIPLLNANGIKSSETDHTFFPAHTLFQYT